MIGRRSFLQLTGGALAAGSAIGSMLGRAVAADCVGATITDGSLARFRSQIAGSVILPNDVSYSSARRLYNQRFDSYPVFIVRAVNESDIAKSIEFARVNGVRLAIRSGGHSYIGASGGTGIVLDLSLMSTVTAIGTGMFRIGTGARLQQVYEELSCNGNWTVPCGSCNTVGFGGIAQGGGFGYLQRAYGLTCDRIRSMRVVLADGTAVNASPDGDADLFWALRGSGGGSLGVVTHFDVEAVPQSQLHNFTWFWPLAIADQAISLMSSLQQSGVIPNLATPSLSFSTGTATMSPQPQCQATLLSIGTLAETAAIKQLFVGAGGIPETPGLGYQYEQPFPVCHAAVSPEFGWYRSKSAMVYGTPASDTGAFITEWINRRLADPALGASNVGSVSLLGMRGVIGSVAANETAFPHRDALFDVQIYGGLSQVTPASSRANDAWLRGIYADVFPRLSTTGSGCYVNYCDADLLETEWPSLYWGANYPRLQATKRRVDPGDFFHGKQTIRI
jgi:hypothetical protein